MVKEKDKTEDKAQEAAQEEVRISKSELEELRAQISKVEEHQDRALRQQADFENMRKRLERQQQDFIKFAHEDIIVDLLGILDDLERSINTAQEKKENFEAFLKGVEMILAHLYDLLKKRGVTPLPAQGLVFNPYQHEALMQTETTEYEDGRVIEELQKGYKLNDRVIRTAKVRVAKNIQQEAKENVEQPQEEDLSGDRECNEE